MTTTKTNKTIFAIAGVALLLGVAFAATLFMGGDAETEFTQSTQGDAMSGLGSLAAMGGIAAPSQISAGSISGDFDAQADAITSAGIDAASGTYTVDGLRSDIEGAAAGSFSWENVESTVYYAQSEVAVDDTGNEEVDNGVDEAERNAADVKALWGSSDVQMLFATADETLAPAGVTVPGLLRSPFGASNSADPDADGAEMAQAHADAFLSTVNGGYGNIETGLDSHLAVQDDLATEVQAVFTQAETSRADAHAAIEAQFESRMTAIENDATAQRAELEATAAATIAELESRAATAQGDVEARAAAAQSDVETAAADAQSELDAQVEAIHAEATSRMSTILSLEAQAQSELNAGDMTRADFDAFMAASAQAKAETEAHVSAVNAQADAISAQIDAELASATASIESQAAAAQSDIESRAAALVAEVEAGVITAQSELDATVADAIVAQTEARADADALVDAYVDAHKADVKARALVIVADAQAAAEDAQAVVATVQIDSINEVGNDLDYIFAVAEDYSDVPTPERQAAADAWMSVHGEMESTLGAALMQGAVIEAKADALASAAADAEASISALF